MGSDKLSPSAKSNIKHICRTHGTAPVSVDPISDLIFFYQLCNIDPIPAFFTHLKGSESF